MSSGYWGAPTSTLDWCEENYHFVSFVAEFCISHLMIQGILLRHLCMSYWLIGKPENSRSSQYWLIGIEFIIKKVSLLINMKVHGIYEDFHDGRSGFSSISLHPAMGDADDGRVANAFRWCSLFVLLVLIDCFCSICFTRKNGQLLIAILVYACAIIASILYVYIGDPIFHQVVYATFILFSLILTMRTHKKLENSRVPILSNNSNAVLGYSSSARFTYLGHFFTVLAFAMWNVDNVFCDYLVHARTKVPFPFDGLLQFHGWWHCFTCLGALNISVGALLNHYLLDNLEGTVDYSLAVRYKWIIPFVTVTSTTKQR